MNIFNPDYFVFYLFHPSKFNVDLKVWVLFHFLKLLGVTLFLSYYWLKVFLSAGAGEGRGSELFL